MKVITVAGNKGGIGKTTVTLILSHYLSMVKGLKGVLIDLDPQGNSSSSTIPMVRDPAYPTGFMPTPHPDWNPDHPSEDDLDWDGISSIADIFLGRQIYPYPTKYNNLDCFPSFGSVLEDAQRVSKTDVKEKVLNRLKEFINLLANESDYEFAVIDTNPQFGPLTMAGLGAATHALLPTELEQYGVDGTIGMIEAIRQEQQRRSKDNPMKYAGILPNQFRHTTVHNRFLTGIQEVEGAEKLLLPPVSQRTIYTELVVEDAKPNCVFSLPDNHVARKESEKWCSFVYDRVFNDVYNDAFQYEDVVNG